MNKALQHAGYKSDWETPQWLFDYCNRRWGPFDVDMAADKNNKKVANYYSAKNPCPIVKPADVYKAWLNPPYGRGIDKWLETAHNWSLRGAEVCVLLPANTSAQWCYDAINCISLSEIYLIKGRVNFVGSTSANTGGSCLFIYKPNMRDDVLIQPLNLDAYRPKRGTK